MKRIRRAEYKVANESARCIFETVQFIFFDIFFVKDIYRPGMYKLQLSLQASIRIKACTITIHDKQASSNAMQTTQQMVQQDKAGKIFQVEFFVAPMSNSITTLQGAQIMQMPPIDQVLAHSMKQSRAMTIQICIPHVHITPEQVESESTKEERETAKRVREVLTNKKEVDKLELKQERLKGSVYVELFELFNVLQMETINGLKTMEAVVRCCIATQYCRLRKKW